ncbi:hypothetical protein V8G54_008613, partial [Vigna mungo]
QAAPRSPHPLPSESHCWSPTVGVPHRKPFYGDFAVEIFEVVLRANLRFPSTIFRYVFVQAKDLLRKMICRDPSGLISTHQALSMFIPFKLFLKKVRFLVLLY